MHQRITFEQRFWEGEVTSIESNVLHVALPRECRWANTARILEEDLEDGRKTQDYGKGEKVKIFLRHPSNVGPKLWFASIRWAHREQNPWIIQPPVLNTEIIGTAVHYAGDRAVFVRLDHTGIDAFLPIAEIPTSHTKINEAVHIGDRIAGVVNRVNTDALEIEIAVRPLLEKKRYEEFRRRKKEAGTPGTPTVINDSEAIKPVHAALRANVAIIDDDKFFVDALSHWLDRIGIENFHIKKPKVLRQILKEDNRPTHILLDYHLDSIWNMEDVQRLTAASGIPSIIISGDMHKASEAAKRHGLPFLLKPLDLHLLVNWLEKKQVPGYGTSEKDFVPANYVDNEAGGHWYADHQTRQVQSRAHELLCEVGKAAECEAVLWVREERKGVYGLRAWYGIDESKIPELEMQMPHSAVANVVETESELEMPLFKSGPLSSAVSMTSGNVWIFSIQVKGQGARILVFYRRKSFDDRCKEKIRASKPCMRDLVERISLMQYLQQTETFAAIGRATSGLMHEMRGAAAPLQQWAEVLQMQLEDTGNISREELILPLREIAHEAERIAALAKTDLAMIQRARRERLPIKKTLQHILFMMRIRAREQDCVLDARLYEEELIVSLPPAILEQPLLNLLDNALFHVKNRDWGRISIRLSLDFADAKTPIHIELFDNGNGMTAEEIDHAFTPRYTSKGRQGTGMGLYVSRNLLRAVGGDLEIVENVRWLGTRFRIRLPVRLKDMKD